MELLTFPAFRENDTAVELSEVLAMIPDNDFIWSILYFDGVGIAPENLSMGDFKDKVRAEAKGFIMSWHQLKQFAATLHQAIDAVIVAAQTEEGILSVRKDNNDFLSCEIFIEAFDSTEWSLWARDSVVMQRFGSVY